MANTRSDSPARLYAKIVGVSVVLVGIVGVLAGNPEDGLFGLFNIDVVEDVIHLTTGGLLTYVGFAGSNRAVKAVVAVLGVVYLLVGGLGFIIPELFGLIPHEYSLADNILHLTLGALALAAALGTTSKERATER